MRLRIPDRLARAFGRRATERPRVVACQPPIESEPIQRVVEAKPEPVQPTVRPTDPDLDDAALGRLLFAALEGLTGAASQDQAPTQPKPVPRTTGSEALRRMPRRLAEPKPEPIRSLAQPTPRAADNSEPDMDGAEVGRISTAALKRLTGAAPQGQAPAQSAAPAGKPEPETKSRGNPDRMVSGEFEIVSHPIRDPRTPGELRSAADEQSRRGGLKIKI